MDYKSFFRYIRIDLCLASFFIPLLAFTISYSDDYLQLFIVSVIIALSVAATYSYNSLKDINEDKDNSLHPNPLKKIELSSVEKKIPYIMLISALLISFLFTNIHSFSLFLFSILFSIAYSKFRIKRFFLIKTVSISFCYAVLFFSCYLAFSDAITNESLVTDILFCILIFSYALLSDIRDIESDRKYNIITIPVRYGYWTSILIILCIFVLFNIIITISYVLNLISLRQATIFYMFVPFQLYMLYSLYNCDLTKISPIQFASFASIIIFLLESLF